MPATAGHRPPNRSSRPSFRLPSPPPVQTIVRHTSRLFGVLIEETHRPRTIFLSQFFISPHDSCGLAHIHLSSSSSSSSMGREIEASNFFFFGEGKVGVSLSGNCNFVEMRLLDNLCGGESSVHHARRRWTDGPSCSGNLPNLIVSGDFFSRFYSIPYRIWNLLDRNGRARGMRQSRDRMVSRVIQERISRKFIRTFRNVRNFNFIRWARQVFSVNLPIWWFRVGQRRDNRKRRDFRVETSIHQSSLLLIRSRGSNFEWQVFSRYVSKFSFTV